MADLTLQLWNDKNQNGKNSPYYGAQGQCGIADTNSLETYNNAWVIIFNKDNYDPDCSGDYIEILPNTPISKLDDTQRLDSNDKVVGDWKNQVKSFIIYQQEPSWFGKMSNSKRVRPSYQDLFTPGSGQALVTSSPKYNGDNAILQGPYNGNNLHYDYYGSSGSPIAGDSNGTIQSLSTGPNTWMIIFDSNDCKGNFKMIGPNIPYNDLNEVHRQDINGNTVGDWKNQIKACLVYNVQPEFWSTNLPRPYIKLADLSNLYQSKISSSSDNFIKYEVCDDQYTINNPEFKAQSTKAVLSVNDGDPDGLPSDGWTKYYVSLAHNNPVLVKNDNASFNLYFNNKGQITCISNFQWSNSSAMNVSQAAIKIVDDTAWYLGAAGAIESLGISEEVADDFVDTFDFICKAFNDIADLVYKRTNNGGSVYFLPVICHTINRIATSVLDNFNNPTFSHSNASCVFNFNDATFLSKLTQYSGSSNNLDWQTQTHGNYPLNRLVNYAVSGNNCKTWFQEYSISAKIGMLLSCKIDCQIPGDTGTGDQDYNYIVLMMGFQIPPSGNVPVLSFAQAFVQFSKSQSDSFHTPAYVSNPILNENHQHVPYYTTDIIQSIVDYFNTKCTGNNQYLSNVVQYNMTAMKESVTYSS